MFFSLRTKNEKNEEYIQVGEDFISLITPLRTLEKKQLEKIQMEKYQQIAFDKFPEHLCKILVDRDRPDFFVERDGVQIGVDVAAFSWTDSRRNSSKFRAVREYLRAAHSAGRLTQCAGLRFMISLNSKKFPDVKDNQSFQSSLDEMIAAFETYTIDVDAWNNTDVGACFAAGGDFPFPMRESGASTCGVLEWYVSGTGPIVSSFGRQCSFEIFHQATMAVTVADIKDRLDEIVGKHDRKPDQQIDEMVIVAGGPDNEGDALAEEESIASFFVQNGGEIAAPRLIKKVVLVQWSNAKIDVLYDGAHADLVSPTGELA